MLVWDAVQSGITNLEKLTAEELTSNFGDSESLSIAEDILVLARRVDGMRPKSHVSADTILKAVELRNGIFKRS